MNIKVKIRNKELSETNKEPTFRIQKKSGEKNRKIIFASEFSKTNNEPTFG